MYDYEEEDSIDFTSLEALPQTPEMLEFCLWDQKEKEAKAKKEALRQTILKQYQTLKRDFQGIKISKVKTRKLNNEKYYDWVVSITSPEVLEEIRLREVDFSKFEEYYLKGRIKYEQKDLPEDLISTTESYRVEVTKDKK